MINLKKALLYYVRYISNIVSVMRYLAQRYVGFAAGICLLGLFSGCGIYKAPEPPVDYCYLNPDKNLFTVGRAAVIELNNESSYPQASIDVTESLFQAIQKKQLFSLSIVRQYDPAWRSLQFDPDSPYTLEQLFEIRRALRADAMLIGTVTGYRPYPHTAIGLRLKLVDLRDGQLLWAIEQVWDSADRITAYRIKNYFKKNVASNSDRLREQLVSVSQLEFIKFVASETADTMLPKE